MLEEILDSYAQGPEGQNAPLPEEARKNLASGLLSQINTFVLLAYVDNEAVGTAVFFWGYSTFRGKPFLNIHDFAVLPEFRSQGIGGALL